jgi:2-(1,2-epoxy-1,2-dihydrophenyl)acetyl-CoA isomerase
MGVEFQDDETASLLVEDQGRLRILTLNRPERLNALTPELHHLLQQAVLAAAQDTSVGAVALTGAGRAFCSGGDVKRSAEAAERVRESQEARADALRRHGITTQTLARMPKPTIAIVNGVAAGAGMTLALACDLRVMATDATFRSAYARIALPGDLGISYFLTRLVGPARARELMFVDEAVSAERSLALGLASRLYGAPDEALLFAQGLAEGPSIAFRHMKQNLALAENATLAEVIDREADASARCVRTHDVKEAATAFREKRRPKFEGR